MRKSRRPILIVSRTSRLARAQAQMIGAALGRRHPNLKVEYRWIESEGDQHADAALTDAGGKGLFARAIEEELLAERSDMAIHSLKDLPTQETPSLMIAAVPVREDVRDCLIAADGATSLDQLPQGAKFGTASPRRASQLRRLRPDLRIELIRGNVETRLRKVIQDRQYDATLLAAAGLRRAGLGEHAVNLLDPQIMLPAACQGAMAIQCRRDDHVSLTRCLPLNHAATAAAAHVERRIVAGLEGDCHSPIAVLAEPEDRDGKAGFRLRVRVLSPDGRQCLDVDAWEVTARLAKRVQSILADLKARGAREVLGGGRAQGLGPGAEG